jgi:ABC-type transporter lipoprotein component MlaA
MIATRGMEFRKMNGDKADDEREDDRLLLDYALSLAAERDEYLAQRDAYLKQRDIAIGERNELRRQLDEAMAARVKIQGKPGEWRLGRR